jgi:hypothetical protein
MRPPMDLWDLVRFLDRERQLALLAGERLAAL